MERWRQLRMKLNKRIQTHEDQNQGGEEDCDSNPAGDGRGDPCDWLDL
jgi:hypothetical protein